MFYEYQCSSRKCRHITEIMRPVSERLDEAFCEKCKSEAIKIISIPSRAWDLKVENEMYPMVNHFLSEPGKPPVVFENATERKTYYKQHGLIDAVTSDADRQTMYSSDGDVSHYDDLENVTTEAQYVRVPDTWETDPNA